MQNEQTFVTRIFGSDDGKVVARLYAPFPDPSPLDGDPNDPPWRCQLEIDFAGRNELRRNVMGVDAMQALLLAISLLKTELRSQKPPIHWLDTDDLGLKIDDYS